MAARADRGGACHGHLQTHGAVSPRLEIGVTDFYRLSLASQVRILVLGLPDRDPGIVHHWKIETPNGAGPAGAAGSLATSSMGRPDTLAIRPIRTIIVHGKNKAAE